MASRGDTVASHDVSNSDILDHARALLKRLESAAAAAEHEANLAQWEAATTGRKEAYSRYEKAFLSYKRLFSTPRTLAEVTDLLDAGRDRLEPQLYRRLETLRLLFLEHSTAPDMLQELTELETAAERTVSTYRTTLDGNPATSNELAGVLRESEDRDRRRGAWLALKEVGPVVASDIVRLARLRNRMAESAGYPDYWHMQLGLSETDPVLLTQTLDRTAAATDEPYRAAKRLMDEAAADRLGITESDVMPWDFSDAFLQELPGWMRPDVTRYYEQSDPVKSAEAYYETLGFDVASILNNSSLEEAPGKNPHAFCTDIDRKGDVRVLANVKNDLHWHTTMLHELGHALYATRIAPSLPWSLRNEAHALTTEGVAMFFDRVAATGGFLTRIVGLDQDLAARAEGALGRAQRLSKLIFIRWCLVMIQFEKALYVDPGGDLEETWWELVSRFQLLRRPPDRTAADWATKIHLVITPVYYQNYLLGEMFAAQLRNRLGTDDPSFIGQTGVSELLVEKVFGPGRTYPWPELIERATGEPLSERHLLNEIV